MFNLKISIILIICMLEKVSYAESLNIFSSNKDGVAHVQTYCGSGTVKIKSLETNNYLAGEGSDGYYVYSDATSKSEKNGDDFYLNCQKRYGYITIENNTLFNKSFNRNRFQYYLSARGKNHGYEPRFKPMQVPLSWEKFQIKSVKYKNGQAGYTLYSKAHGKFLTLDSKMNFATTDYADQYSYFVFEK